MYCNIYLEDIVGAWLGVSRREPCFSTRSLQVVFHLFKYYILLFLPSGVHFWRGWTTQSL